MVTIRVFNSRVEADLAKGLLESEGIPAHVSADDQGGLSPGMAYANGVTLKVDEEDAEEARKLLVESFYTD